MNDRSTDPSRCLPRLVIPAQHGISIGLRETTLLQTTIKNSLPESLPFRQGFE